MSSLHQNWGAIVYFYMLGNTLDSLIVCVCECVRECDLARVDITEVLAQWSSQTPFCLAHSSCLVLKKGAVELQALHSHCYLAVKGPFQKNHLYETMRDFGISLQMF